MRNNQYGDYVIVVILRLDSVFCLWLNENESRTTESDVQEVSEFVVIAPANLGKAVHFAEERIKAHLGRAFPHYTFRIEPFGPLCDEEGYTVIPIMNRKATPGEQVDPDRIFLCKPLDPRVIPQIEAELCAFDLAGAGVH